MTAYEMRISDWSSDVCSSDLSVDLGYLVIDLIGSAATIALALLAHRFWPMIVAVLHVLPLLAHISRALDVSMNPIAYLTMQVASSWLLPPLLILATWRHQQRLRRSGRSEEHTSELQSLMRISYAVFCLKKKTT